VPAATRSAALAACLLPALLTGACSSFSSGGENFNKPAVYEGPGCYDHKGRMERTITQPVECQRQGWVWKTAP
jgi:hypothetical protein